MYYRNANCAVVVYDITQAVSFALFSLLRRALCFTQLHTTTSHL